MPNITYNQSTKIGRWLRNHPAFLESAYNVTEWIFDRIKPLIERIGYKKVEHWIRPVEEWAKGVVFDCRMCGQCVLHYTGMTCPMTCPKNLRNGPCGVVRENGHCEVVPEMPFVWVEDMREIQFYRSRFHYIRFQKMNAGIMVNQNFCTA